MKIKKTLIHSLIIVSGMTLMSCEKETTTDQIIESKNSEQASAKNARRCNLNFVKKAGLQAIFWNADGETLTASLTEKVISFDSKKNDLAYLDFESEKFFDRPFFKSRITQIGFKSKNVLENDVRMPKPVLLTRTKKQKISNFTIPIDAVDKKASNKSVTILKRRTFKKGERIAIFTKIKGPTKTVVGITTTIVSPKKGCPRLF